MLNTPNNNTAGVANPDELYEFTQPTQLIDENTQQLEDELENSQNNKLVGTLVTLNAYSTQHFNLYLNTPILIGRHRTCDIIVNSNYSSNKHCKIYATESTGIQKDIVFCEDLSTNGTLWNGTIIGKGNKVLLDITFLKKDRIFVKPSKEDGLNISSNYQITDQVLGSGTFAKVHLAIRKDTNEQVAVKIMDKKDNNHGSIGGGTNYIDEINLLKAFDHPNIVRVFEVQESEKQVYIFMPLISGGDLFDHITKSSSLSEQETKFITYQLLLALKYLHERGISHRDVKPENILLGSKETYSRVYLSDFGMARVVNEGSRMKTICGTFQYIAPEIINTGLKRPISGKIGYGLAVDCWSLGVVIYAMLSGMLPFHSPDGNDQALFAQILNGKLDLTPPVWNSISDHGKDFVQLFMVKDPNSRMTIKEAFNHPWMKPYLPDLAKLYARKVKAGDEKGAGKSKISEDNSRASQSSSSCAGSGSSPERHPDVTRKRTIDSIRSPTRKQNDRAQVNGIQNMSPPRTPNSARRRLIN
ncbi:hypothetical protein BB560_005571 [Smittium megazygosporum]|uniref:Uncharacterized protein n=1 Tax=Smittium megazygosporum TaxID=133381 RepID=A0A2T9Z308_9FUNG|nr:hypothetical protein BB560_005571 [Smittium megazygosporum]